jgi:hypothetical protein
LTWRRVVGLPLYQFAAFESGAGADEGDEVGCADRAPPGLGGFDELNQDGQTGGFRAGPVLTLLR